MTDMEMDLIIAQARIKQLEQELAEVKNPVKCSWGDGVTFKPDGENELDPCTYELLEQHKNVTVEVLRCTKCGHIEVEWYVPDDTEDGDFDD